MKGTHALICLEGDDGKLRETVVELEHVGRAFDLPIMPGVTLHLVRVIVRGEEWLIAKERIGDPAQLELVASTMNVEHGPKPVRNTGHRQREARKRLAMAMAASDELRETVRRVWREKKALERAEATVKRASARRAR